MILKLADLETYAFADPASGKNTGKLKKQRARQAITVISCDRLLRVFVRYAWAGREHPAAYRDRIVDVYAKYRPRRFGIEANAMQELFGRLVMDRAKEKVGTHQGIIPWDTPTKIEKAWKIRTVLQPLLNDGRLFVMSEMVELLAELRGFPTYHLRDLADCLAMCVMLIPRRFFSIMHSGDEETDALAKYLRDSGAPSQYIQQRIGDLKKQHEVAFWEMLGGHVSERVREERERATGTGIYR